MEIAIIGKGVIGLTTALSLLNEGRKVNIYSHDDSEPRDEKKTVSVVACALWQPYKLFKNLELQSNTIKRKVKKVSFESLKEFHKHFKLSGSNISGIYIYKHFEYTEESIKSGDDWLEDFYYIDLLDKHWKTLNYKDSILNETKIINPTVISSSSSVQDSKFVLNYLHGYKTYIIDTPVFLKYLETKVEKLGGHFYEKKINYNELKKLKEKIVFNCSGINGFKVLHNNNLPHSNRGKITQKKGVLLLYRFEKSKPFPKTIVAGDLTILCRANYLTIGTGEILTTALDLIAKLKNMVNSILYEENIDDFGLCNFLTSNRIELDTPDLILVGGRPYFPDGKGYLINRIENHSKSQHYFTMYNNFGHGGSGVTLCFGTSQEVLAIYINEVYKTLNKFNPKRLNLKTTKFNIEFGHFDFKEVRNLSDFELNKLFNFEIEIVKKQIKNLNCSKNDYCITLLLDNKEKVRDLKSENRILHFAKKLDIDFVVYENELFQYVNQIEKYFPNSIRKEFDINKKNHIPLGCSQDIFIWCSLRLGIIEFEEEDNTIIKLSQRAKTQRISFYANALITILPERLRKFELRADEYIKKTFGFEIASSIKRIYHEEREK